MFAHDVRHSNNSRAQEKKNRQLDLDYDFFLADGILDNIDIEKTLYIFSVQCSPWMRQCHSLVSV